VGAQAQRTAAYHQAGYEWRLGHLPPHFGELRLSAITVERIDDYKSAKLAEGLGPASINMTADPARPCARSRCDGVVVSVDVSRDVFQAEHHRIVTVTGSTAAPEVSEEVRFLCAGRRTMVIHEASHRAAQVYEDLRAYGPLVSPGCYLIVEDGVTDVVPVRTIGSDPGPGPYRATMAFLDDGAPFDVDASRERFVATNNPRGFLRRREDLQE
jgi:cephalosporin hydroxylase